jgi:hypothetical protein
MGITGLWMKKGMHHTVPGMEDREGTTTITTMSHGIWMAGTIVGTVGMEVGMEHPVDRTEDMEDMVDDTGEVMEGMVDDTGEDMEGMALDATVEDMEGMVLAAMGEDMVGRHDNPLSAISDRPLNVQFTDFAVVLMFRCSTSRESGNAMSECVLIDSFVVSVAMPRDESLNLHLF